MKIIESSEPLKNYYRELSKGLCSIICYSGIHSSDAFKPNMLCEESESFNIAGQLDAELGKVLALMKIGKDSIDMIKLKDLLKNV